MGPLRTTTSLPPEQVALVYRGLWRVENAFRTLKSPLELRPLFHTSEAGISGPSEQHERLLAAIGAPIPERRTALQYEPNS